MSNDRFKFRAWSKSGDYMVSGENELFTGPGVSAYINQYFQDDDLIFMQWTGLYDYYGVEIYEGDIVAQVMYSGGDYPTGNLNVRWDEASACFLYDNDSYRLFLDDMIVKIMGNIYENPELLDA